MTIRMLAAVSLMAFVGLAAPSDAQIPDTFTNLQILPADIGKRELVGIMRGFASGLGVRCKHCHVGENAATLENFDFADDAKETKRIAREMLKMVTDINETYLSRIERDDRIEVSCATCHHGVEKPEQIADVVLGVYEVDGLDPALARYRELRETYYGRSAYDFGHGPLNAVTETLMGRKDLVGALAVIELNVELHPEEAYPNALRARVLQNMGRREERIAALERAVSLDPENGWYRTQLEEARKEGTHETEGR